MSSESLHKDQEPSECKPSSQHTTEAGDDDDDEEEEGSYVRLDSEQSSSSKAFEGTPTKPDDSADDASTTSQSSISQWRTDISHFIVELIHFTRNRSWKKKLLTVVIFGSSVYVLLDLLFLGHVDEFLYECLEWVSEHPASAVACFLLLLIICTLLFVPPAILFFGSGYAFSVLTDNMGLGVLAASIVCYMGCLIGATLAFYRARYMTRDLVQMFAQRFPIIKAADRAFERNGFRVMLLLRLCPIIPFNGLNYIGGVLSVSVHEFIMALAGVIPAMLLWVYCGATSQVLGQARLTKGDGVQTSWIVLLASGICFGVIALVITWKLAIKELTKEIEKDSAENWFRYKKQPSDMELAEASGPESAGKRLQGHTASELIASIEERPLGTEAQAKHRRLRSGILPFIGIDTHRLDDQLDPLDNDEDEEWFWLFA
jgi:uncharacterized membrane protein YdjX (TVP38/TMEM64 family)